jgi:hypothetical protein
MSAGSFRRWTASYPCSPNTVNKNSPVNVGTAISVLKVLKIQKLGGGNREEKAVSRLTCLQLAAGLLG